MTTKPNDKSRPPRKHFKTLWTELHVYPKSGIEQTCQDAVDLANRLAVDVWFEFNEGQSLCASPGDNYVDLVEKYRECHSSQIITLRDTVVDPR